MKYEGYHWPECETCSKRNNKLACLLMDCDVRDKYEREFFAKFEKNCVDKKLCYMCIHCIHKEEMEMGHLTTFPYCSIKNEYCSGEKTCSKWEQKEYEYYGKI